MGRSLEEIQSVVMSHMRSVAVVKSNVELKFVQDLLFYGYIGDTLIIFPQMLYKAPTCAERRMALNVVIGMTPPGYRFETIRIVDKLPPKRGAGMLIHSGTSESSCLINDANLLDWLTT